MRLEQENVRLPSLMLAINLLRWLLYFQLLNLWHRKKIGFLEKSDEEGREMQMRHNLCELSR